MSDVLTDVLKTVNLLLVGRTGNGKSSTGNSILGERVFMPRGSSAAAAVEIKKGSITTKEGCTVNVVDGSGIGDTGADAPEDGRSAVDLVQEAMGRLQYNFTALLVVFKYGVRFTKQEKDAVAEIKALFGENTIGKFGIIIMTHGDSFDLDVEDDGSTFENWCRQQTGDVQALFQETNYRCVLFRNKSKDDAVRKEQYDRLMSMISLVHAAQMRSYSKDDFERAEKGRKKLLVMKKLPELDKSTQKFIDGIQQELEKLDQQRRSPDDSLIQLQNIAEMILECKQQVMKEDEGTGSVENILLPISVLESGVNSKIVMQQRVIENEKRQRVIENEKSQRVIENEKRQRELESKMRESEKQQTEQWEVSTSGEEGKGGGIPWELLVTVGVVCFTLYFCVIKRKMRPRC